MWVNCELLKGVCRRCCDNTTLGLKNSTLTRFSIFIYIVCALVNVYDGSYTCRFIKTFTEVITTVARLHIPCSIYNNCALSFVLTSSSYNIMLQNEEVCDNTIYSSSEASGVNHIIHRSRRLVVYKTRCANQC